MNRLSSFPNQHHRALQRSRSRSISNADIGSGAFGNGRDPDAILFTPQNEAHFNLIGGGLLDLNHAGNVSDSPSGDGESSDSGQRSSTGSRNLNQMRRKRSRERRDADDEVSDEVEVSDDGDDGDDQQALRFGEPPRQRRQRVLSTEGVQDEAICCICQEVGNCHSTIDSCDHKYCFGCIFEWHEIRNTCPQCRRSFSEIIERDANGNVLRTLEIALGVRLQIYVEMTESISNNNEGDDSFVENEQEDFLYESQQIINEPNLSSTPNGLQNHVSEQAHILYELQEAAIRPATPIFTAEEATYIVAVNEFNQNQFGEGSDIFFNEYPEN